jgi:hypothetical protein
MTPTLEELLTKFRGLLRDGEFKTHADEMESHFRKVAIGMCPMLTESNAMMAAQCVVVILEHVKNEVEQ